MSEPNDALVQRSTTIRSGLKTSDRLERDVAALEVAWIEWDSGFRGTGLRVGDLIVAVDGVPLPRPATDDDRARSRAVGQSQEAAGWAERGARDGQPLRLTIRRKRIPGDGWETAEIEGRLLADRSYRNADGRSVMGPGGPQRLSRDEFPESWAPWYEKRVYDWERQLDSGTWAGTADNRIALARHLEAEPRVRALAECYPGPFAGAVVSDWEAVHEVLRGRRYEVPKEEYAYRDAEQQLTADVTAAAVAAWEAFQAAHLADIIPAPGPLNLLEGDDEKYVGKLVVLGPASPEDWISDVGKVFVSWRENAGWLLTPLVSPALDRMWHAQIRYRRSLSPQIDDTFRLIGRIRKDPRIVSPKGEAAVIGLDVEPVAALMGQGEEQMFVDLTVDRDGVSPFAAEETVLALPSALPPDDASPRQVLEALVAALYARDVTTWFALYADWRFVSDEARPFYYPFYPYPEANRDAHWTHSRRIVLDRTYAIRVAWVDEPRVVAPDILPDIPMIERVSAELDHVGLFDGEHRTFNSPEVRRTWTLERRDGGPWRITSHQGI